MRVVTISYTADGERTCGSNARGDELDTWRADREASGWTVVDESGGGQ
ncbi:hypothetical protein OHA25_60650 (plasmid) [Nonomuraea sp. NBC_00507]